MRCVCRMPFWVLPRPSKQTASRIKLTWAWELTVCTGTPDELQLSCMPCIADDRAVLSLGDNQGKPYVLPSVLAAEDKVTSARLDKEYAGITGVPSFTKAAAELAFG